MFYQTRPWLPDWQQRLGLTGDSITVDFLLGFVLILIRMASSKHILWTYLIYWLICPQNCLSELRGITICFTKLSWIGSNHPGNYPHRIRPVKRIQWLLNLPFILNYCSISLQLSHIRIDGKERTTERGCIASDDEDCMKKYSFVDTPMGRRLREMNCCEEDKCNSSEINLAGWKLLFFTILLTMCAI